MSKVLLANGLCQKKYFELFSSLSAGRRGLRTRGLWAELGDRGAALEHHCGFGVCPIELKETGPSENWNGSHPYDSPLSMASCLALMKAGKGSSKTQNAT